MTQEQRDNKIKRILRHCQTISVLADCISIEMQRDIVDHEWRDPKIANHARRLKESVTQIKVGLASKVKVLNREELEYNHSTECHRMLEYIATMDTDQLRSINNSFDDLEKNQAHGIYATV